MHVILDLDGTLADHSKRLAFVKDPAKEDWESYNSPELVLKDEPIVEAFDAIQRMQQLRYQLIFVTSRYESTRDATAQWLLKHFNVIVDDYNLVMRPLSNMLRAGEFKAQQMQRLLSEFKAEGGNSFIFIDSDASVFEAYAAEGLVLKAPACWKVMFPAVAVTEAP